MISDAELFCFHAEWCSGVTLGSHSGKHMGCWGSNLGWIHARQKPYLLYCHFGPIQSIYKNSTYWSSVEISIYLFSPYFSMWSLCFTLLSCISDCVSWILTLYPMSGRTSLFIRVIFSFVLQKFILMKSHLFALASACLANGTESWRSFWIQCHRVSVYYSVEFTNAGLTLRSSFWIDFCDWREVGVWGHV